MNESLDDEPYLAERRWPLAATGLLPRERWLWWEQLWSDVIGLGKRSHRSTGGRTVRRSRRSRAGRAGSAVRLRRMDDPPGKLALLFDLERVHGLVRGAEPFHPDRDRAAFVRFLVDTGCQPPPGAPHARRQRRRAQE